MTDWRYADDMMPVRNKVLMHLIENYGWQTVDGVPIYGNKRIYACAHDWISQGNRTLEGLDDFFTNNY